MADENTFSRRLADILREPGETLDMEIKVRLDDDDDARRATLAQAIIALPYDGGGVILIGLAETADEVVAANNRPHTFAGYFVDHSS